MFPSLKVHFLIKIINLNAHFVSRLSLITN
jgi:hypothetical protein